MVKSFKCSRIIFQSRLKLISFDLIFIEKCLLYGAKSTYPICQFFISRKSVDKSGFVDKSGVDKSEDALYSFLKADFHRSVYTCINPKKLIDSRCLSLLRSSFRQRRLYLTPTALGLDKKFYNVLSDRDVGQTSVP